MITYHRLVTAKDIPSLDHLTQNRIRKSIETRLSENPVLYGKPLHGSLRRLWTLRVGDWRVLYVIEKYETFILVIAHRKDIYKLILNKI